MKKGLSVEIVGVVIFILDGMLDYAISQFDNMEFDLFTFGRFRVAGISMLIFVLYLMFNKNDRRRGKIS